MTGLLIWLDWLRMTKPVEMLLFDYFDAPDTGKVSTLTQADRGSTFALRRSTLDFCLVGPRSMSAPERTWNDKDSQGLGLGHFQCESFEKK